MTTICLCLIGVSFLLSAPLCALLIRLGGRLGQVDDPEVETHKSHVGLVPNLGGIAIFLAIALPILVVLVGVRYLSVPAAPGPVLLSTAPVVPHLRGLVSRTPAALALLAVLAVVHVMGLVDDRRKLAAGLKLAVELLAGIVLAGWFDVRVLHFLDRLGPGGTLASVLLSALWIAGMTNAMNMLDNMDGLAAGVGLIIAALYLAATLVGGQWFVAGTCALLCGALFGFLPFNYPRARLFMGDGGSLLLGMLLAVISIRTTYYASEAGASGPAGAWYSLFTPLVVMAVPLYDLVSVSLIRLRAGRSPLQGDQCHFSHRLVRLGLSRRAAVGLIWLATGATGLSGVMLGSLLPWQAALAAAQTLIVVAVLAMLEWGGTRRR